MINEKVNRKKRCMYKLQITIHDENYRSTYESFHNLVTALFRL